MEHPVARIQGTGRIAQTGLQGAAATGTPFRPGHAGNGRNFEIQMVTPRLVRPEFRSSSAPPFLRTGETEREGESGGVASVTEAAAVKMQSAPFCVVFIDFLPSGAFFVPFSSLRLVVGLAFFPPKIPASFPLAD
jgi:hypothetical protein